ncbi:MAG: hypothetical protein R3356_03095 [Eudoraea sp.]|nr:hypothetical protein [Eudoraea sp.]
MRPKHKALFFNFVAFAIIFLTIRLSLEYFWPGNSTYLALISAIITIVISPKFAAIKTNSGEKLMMKWIFIKKVREL